MGSGSGSEEGSGAGERRPDCGACGWDETDGAASVLAVFAGKGEQLGADCCGGGGGLSGGGAIMPALTAETILAMTEGSVVPVRATENSTTPSGATWMRKCVGVGVIGRGKMLGEGWETDG